MPDISVSSNSSHSALAARIRATGARATPARVRVLQMLTAAPAPLSHHDIETALGADGLDRVTLYRVLDWAVESGLAVKSADARRVWRFALAAAGEHGRHSHFRCDGCGRVFCLDAPAPVPPALPAGFALRRADYSLAGRCAECNEVAK